MSVIDTRQPKVRFEIKHKGRWHSVGRVLSASCGTEYPAPYYISPTIRNRGYGVTKLEVEFRPKARSPFRKLLEPYAHWKVRLIQEADTITIDKAMAAELEVRFDTELKERWLFLSSHEPKVTRTTR